MGKYPKNEKCVNIRQFDNPLTVQNPFPESGTSVGQDNTNNYSTQNVNTQHIHTPR